MLTNNIKIKVPENVLSQCKTHDTQVVENILMACSHMCPITDVNNCCIENVNNSYRLKIPLARGCLSYHDLSNIAHHAPTRIEDIVLNVKNAELPTLDITIADETKPILISDVEIVRVKKRSRWNLW